MGHKNTFVRTQNLISKAAFLRVFSKDYYIYVDQSPLNMLSLRLKGTKCIKGVLHPWTLFLKTARIFSKNKATSDKIYYGSGQKCSKELKNHSFTSVETIVVKLQ